MTEEDKIWRDGLKALCDENPEPSPDVEKRLLREFRAQRKPAARWVWWGIPVAAAIAGVVIGAIWFWTRPAPAHNTVTPQIVQAPLQAKPIAPLAPAVDKVVAAKRVASIRRPPRKRKAVPEPQLPLEFIELPYAELAGPLVRGTVVRMSLPGSAIAVVGLPVNPDRMFEPVQADVVLGEDGIARAIRFVSYR